MIFISKKVFFTGSDFSANGGTLTTDGGDNIHTFTSDGTFVAEGTTEIDILVVAGGGGGGENRGGGGGGGGIEDAPNDGQNYVRKNRKWVVSTGGGGKFADDSVGIHTTSNVGLGTTARSDSTLYVDGSATITGALNVTGDLVYDEANARNWNITGIATVATAFYMPQYTTTARDAATFNEGAMIYNTTTKKMEFYDGTSWTSLPGMSLGLTVALDG